MTALIVFDYRDVSAFAEMVSLCEEFPDDLRNNLIVQFALGLNRRNQPADHDGAAQILEGTVARPAPETLGLSAAFTKIATRLKGRSGRR